MIHGIRNQDSVWCVYCILQMLLRGSVSWLLMSGGYWHLILYAINLINSTETVKATFLGTKSVVLQALRQWEGPWRRCSHGGRVRFVMVKAMYGLWILHIIQNQWQQFKRVLFDESIVRWKENPFLRAVLSKKLSSKPSPGTWLVWTGTSRSSSPLWSVSRC